MEKRLESPESLIPINYIHRMMKEGSMRSPRTKHYLIEIRHLLDNMMELSKSEKSKSPKARVEQDENMMRIRHMMDRLMQFEEW